MLIVSFLQNWGWTLVLLLISVYIASPYVKNYLDKQRLKEARDPEREKVLTHDMKKARVRQQMDFYKMKKEQLEQSDGV